MHINRIKLTEWAIQLLAVLVFVLVGLDSYERHLESLGEVRNIGLMISTNSNQIFWHIFIYGMYMLTWFMFYYGIYKRFEDSLKKKVQGGVTGWILFSLIHLLLVFLISNLLQSQAVSGDYILNFSIVFELGETIFDMYFIIGVVAFMAQTTVQFLYRYRELERADYMQSELSLIRSQLRPHFFFNTLNNLYSMALETKNEDLANGIANLTGMMRYSLKHSSKELVPLHEEWEYIRKYVELQKLRINQESVDISMETREAVDSVQVAPMILINFIENAFKHGISIEKHSYVHVNMDIVDDSIMLDVRNSNHPSKQDTGSSGIGTSQTRKLLALYYENNFSLDIKSTSEEYRVTLKLPIR